MAEADPSERLAQPLPALDIEPRAAIPMRTTGSLSRRMILIAAGWILLLLTGGGFALDRVLTTAVTRNFDDQIEYVLNSLITSAEVGPMGEVINNRELADQRFLEPGSGLYYQVSAPGQEPYPSRSLWDRQLAYGGAHRDRDIHAYDSDQFVDKNAARKAAAGAVADDTEHDGMLRYWLEK